MEILDFEDYCKTINIWQDNCRHSVIAPVGIANSQNFEIEYSTKSLVNGHTILLGCSGSGKTVFLHTFIIGLALKYSPEEVRFILADYHGCFERYASYKLPHADFIAYPAYADVLLHLLEVAKSKIEERARLFNDCRVGNYSDFREKYPDEKLPRYFVIFDGYERLFMNAEYRREAKQYIEFITKHAIAINYGINMVMVSQWCPLTREILNNFTTKIVLKCEQTDVARMLLGPENRYIGHVPCLQYEAIIATADNHNKTRLYYLSPEKRDRYLDILANKAKEEHVLTPRLLVSNGTAAAYLSNNRTYSQMKSQPHIDSALFSPGETVFNDGNDLMKTFDRTKRQNIFVTGGDLIASTRALYGCLASMLPQFETGSGMVFDMFNFINPLEEFKKTLDKKLQSIADSYPGSKVGDDTTMEEILNDTFSSLEERKQNVGRYYPPRFIVMFQMNKSKVLNPVTVRKSYGETRAVSPLLNKLSELVKEGPEYGIHCLLHTSDIDGLFDICCKKPVELLLTYIKHRVLLQMNEDESKLMMKGRNASYLYNYDNLDERSRTNRAIYYNTDTPNVKSTIIKPYEFEISPQEEQPN